MSLDARAQEVARLLSALTKVEGGMTIELLERKYPRLGVAEAGTGYVESDRTFKVGSAAAPALPDADEFVIVVRGAVDPAAEKRNPLRQKLHDLVDTADVGPHWDCRARIGTTDGDRWAYELEVFTCFAAAETYGQA